MSKLTVDANDLQDEGLDTETVDLGTSDMTTATNDLGTSDLQVGIGGGGAREVGIQSIEQTTTSTEDGGINEVTQTLTDGTTAVFQIRNGSKGSQGIQGERGEKGDAGDDWIPTQQELASIASSAAALVDVPTKTSDLQNDSGFITGYKETDPTVPSWAKRSTKPTYTASEVGALPASTTIPSALADLSADSTHRTVTDTEKSNWNSKGTYSKPSGGIPASDIASGVIPTNCVSSTDITNVVYLTQAAYDALATKDANTLYIIPES